MHDLFWMVVLWVAGGSMFALGSVEFGRTKKHVPSTNETSSIEDQKEPEDNTGLLNGACNTVGALCIAYSFFFLIRWMFVCESGDVSDSQEEAERPTAQQAGDIEMAAMNVEPDQQAGGLDVAAMNVEPAQQAGGSKVATNNGEPCQQTGGSKVTAKNVESAQQARGSEVAAMIVKPAQQAGDLEKPVNEEPAQQAGDLQTTSTNVKDSL